VLLVETDHTPGNPLDEALDAAYHAKYGRWPGPVERITSEQAHATRAPVAGLSLTRIL
jgi:hypothetical protein